MSWQFKWTWSLAQGGRGGFAFCVLKCRTPTIHPNTSLYVILLCFHLCATSLHSSLHSILRVVPNPQPKKGSGSELVPIEEKKCAWAVNGFADQINIYIYICLYIYTPLLKRGLRNLAFWKDEFFNCWMIPRDQLEKSSCDFSGSWYCPPLKNGWVEDDPFLSGFRRGC